MGRKEFVKVRFFPGDSGLTRIPRGYKRAAQGGAEVFGSSSCFRYDRYCRYVQHNGASVLGVGPEIFVPAGISSEVSENFQRKVRDRSKV